MFEKIKVVNSNHLNIKILTIPIYLRNLCYVLYRIIFQNFIAIFFNLTPLKSMMPFNVVWSFGESRIGPAWVDLTHPRLFQPSDPIFHEIERVSDTSEGYYKCRVNTPQGSDEASTYLDVEEQPPVIEGDKELRIGPGFTARISCNVTSKVPFELTWSRRGSSYSQSTSVNSPRINQEGNGVLVIERVSILNLRKYMLALSIFLREIRLIKTRALQNEYRTFNQLSDWSK